MCLTRTSLHYLYDLEKGVNLLSVTTALLRDETSERRALAHEH